MATCLIWNAYLNRKSGRIALPFLQKRTRDGVQPADKRGRYYVSNEKQEVNFILTIRPITLRAANAFVTQYHRHNQPTNGHKWSVACYNGEKLCGVAIAGQPVARRLDDGLTIEIRRVCTDGTRNACSVLYGACARIAREMGYKRVVTYTLLSELGTSLRASGFKDCGEAGGVPWNVPGRPREIMRETAQGPVQKYSLEKKRRWEKRFGGGA